VKHDGSIMADEDDVLAVALIALVVAAILIALFGFA
jgi:hypothetical protein